MRKILLCLFILMFLNVAAQEKEAVNTHHSFGFHAGSTTGIGLSYRLFHKKIGVQVTGIPFFLQNNEYFLSGGVTLMFKLKSTRRIDFFTYLGNNYNFKSSSNTQQYPNPPPQQPITSGQFPLANFNLETGYNIGLGGGINLHAWIDVLDVSFQLGYGVFNVDSSPRSVLASEIGIYYKL